MKIQIIIEAILDCRIWITDHAKEILIMKPKKCPNCQGELTTKQVEKILKGGVHTAILQIEAEVCLNCGERLYIAVLK